MSHSVTETVLVVDDDLRLSRYLSRFLEGLGYRVEKAGNCVEAREAMARVYPDVVLMDLRLPDCNGRDLMVELKKQYSGSEFIIITAEGSIRSAVLSTRMGAADYLAKPFDMEELQLAIRNVVQRHALAEEVRRRRSNEVSGSCVRDQGTGRGHATVRSAAMRQTMSLAEKAAAQEGIVLLLGESGTGKDYLARLIHRRSRRSGNPYFCINCAALSAELAESELFGHEPGAFTGTRGRKRGLLELARGGTLLLNEIGELPLALQSKLLTFLDTKSFIRVGGERSISIDTRLIAATNRNLTDEVAAGRFRQDLYYRLDVFPIELPPLRRRRADIPGLAAELLARLTRELGIRRGGELGPEAVDILVRYPWPGNVRELRNVLERALIHSGGGPLEPEHLKLEATGEPDWRVTTTFSEEGCSLHEATRHLARELVREALRRGKNKTSAARLLGISRHALTYQIKTLDL